MITTIVCLILLLVLLISLIPNNVSLVPRTLLILLVSCILLILLVPRIPACLPSDRFIPKMQDVFCSMVGRSAARSDPILEVAEGSLAAECPSFLSPG